MHLIQFQLNAAIFYPYALSFGAEALVSIKRIEEFLTKGEKNEAELGIERRSSMVLSDTKRRLIHLLRRTSALNNLIFFRSICSIENIVEINDVSASWEENATRNTLEKINLKIRPGELCAVIGPVGAGKSSLVQLLLGELPIESGKVLINGSLSYAAQKPWLFSGTVRNNILFGQIYDKKRYNEVSNGGMPRKFNRIN